MAPSPDKLIEQAVAELKRTTLGYRELDPKTAPSGHWAAGLELLEQARKATAPKPKPKPPAINLGPIVKGGVSILDQDLTHVTDGLDAHGSVWPALDDGLGHPGLEVIAPELVEITGHGRAKRRDGNPDGVSLNLALGRSGLEYWIAHLDPSGLAAIGQRVAKGGKLGVISSNHEAPHVHIAINARKLLGRDLEHHRDYTHGAPKIRAQLKAAGLI